MALVQISYTFENGARVLVTVKAETSYPDALAEAKAIALSTWREAYVDITTPDTIERGSE